MTTTTPLTSLQQQIVQTINRASAKAIKHHHIQHLL